MILHFLCFNLTLFLMVCKQDLDTHLQKYLCAENERLSKYPSRKSIRRFKESLTDFRRFINKRRARNTLSRLLNDRATPECVINIITFNYTDTIDVLWEKIPDVMGNYIKGEFIYIHGTTDNMMVSGVNDETQIANEHFRTNEEILDYSVKPRMNDSIGNAANETASDLIDDTDIFVVFGMSIGATDKKWWDRIAQQVLRRQNSYLLFVNYDSNVQQSLPYSSTNPTRKVLDIFFGITNLNAAEQKSLLNTLNTKVEVLLNTDMFKISNYSFKKRLENFFMNY